jgi:hypothetical protein
MHQLGGVRGRQSAPRVAQHFEDLVRRASLGREPRREGHPVDELHRDEHALVPQPDVVHRDHVRVGQLGQRLRLAQQALLAVVAGEVGAQELEGHLAIELRIVGGVDDTHATLAEPFEHHVAAEHAAALELVRGLAHRGEHSSVESHERVRSAPLAR